MQSVYRARARVGEHGELILENLPFTPGERVEVTIVRAGASESDPPQPMEPVTEHEWDVLE